MERSKTFRGPWSGTKRGVSRIGDRYRPQARINRGPQLDEETFQVGDLMMAEIQLWTRTTILKTINYIHSSY